MLSRSVVLILGLLVSVIPSLSFADFLGLYVGGGVWKSDFRGDVVSDVDVDDELGISSDSSYDVYIAFEHPVPLIPNVRLARASVHDSGTGSLATAFDFEGTPFAVNDVVKANLDLTYTDLTLYYEIWDMGFDLDLGLTARKFDGEMEINTTRQKFDEFLPMLYLGAKVGLPFSGLYLAATVNGLVFSGSKFTDYALKIGWETSSFLFPEFGVEVGYRNFSLNVDQKDANVDLDVGLSGVFLNLVAHF